jgi:hypothetical protein
MSQDQDQDAGGKSILSELKAIKRLLALLLLREGVAQKQVARAASIGNTAMTELANAGLSEKKKNSNTK